MAYGELMTAVKGFVIETVKGAALDMLFPGGAKIPEAYRVTVTSSTHGSVWARLQKDFTLGSTSRWEPFIKGVDNPTIAAIAGLFNRSLQLAVTSRRVWLGTSPVRIELPLVFLAEDNVDNDVIKYVQALQYMALPKNPTTGAGFLVPPGPSPFVGINGLEGGDQIDVSIGKVLGFQNVIVKEVTVTYSTRMSAEPEGRPMMANVLMVFETYEIITAEGLQKAYKDVPPASNTASAPAGEATKLGLASGGK